MGEKAGETPEKEQIELTEEGAEEKDDSTETEKTKKKKEKKEKKKKEPKPPKEKKPKGPSCVETLSAGLDLTNRDGKSINTDVCLDFDDVLAEPAGAHGVDPIWQISFILFSQTKLWLYRIFAALLAVPAAVMWALVLSLRPKKKTRKKKILCNDLISHITYIPYFIYLTQQVKRKHRFKEQSHYNFQPDIDF